jgi:hypothetical protein
LAQQARQDPNTGPSDVKTRALLLVFPAGEALIQGEHGPLGAALDSAYLDRPAERVVRFYVIQYRNWLLRKERNRNIGRAEFFVPGLCKVEIHGEGKV